MSEQKAIELTKHLREITGAGLMDCKKALIATNWNEEEAIEFLKEKPFRIVCGKVPCSRVTDCMYCQKEKCENEYDEESMTCKKCLVRKCMEDK